MRFRLFAESHKEIPFRSSKGQDRVYLLGAEGEQLIAELSRYLPEGGPGWNFTRIALHRDY